MVVHRRAAALVVALFVALVLPAAVPSGVARGADAGPAFPGPPMVSVVIHGSAVGDDMGSLAGGTVTACPMFPGPTFFCAADAIDGMGHFGIIVPAGAWWRVSISSPAPYADGYYSETSPGNFSLDQGSATIVDASTGDAWLDQMVVPGGIVPPPGPRSISGRVVGSGGGSLAGGTVTACSTWTACFTATIGWNGAYWIGNVPAGTYTLAIEPPAGTGYPSGWYSEWSTGNFALDSWDATQFGVWGTGVQLPLITVPWWRPVPAVGSISGTVVGAGGGSLAGGTVTACSADWSCRSTTIGSGGAYFIGGLPSSVYTISINPPSSSWLIGFYAAGASGNFSTNNAAATGVAVWNTNVTLPTIVVPWSVSYGALTGYATGLSNGALAGGTVTACTAASACTNATIGADGSYAFTSLPAGSYTVKVTPLSGSGYPVGWYAATASGYFTKDAAAATVVAVGGSTVTLPTMVLPWTGGTGGIVVGKPKAYVVWAYLRPEFTEGTTTSLRIAQDERAELASYIDPQLAGMRVEVWRRLKGQAWQMITTRGISGAGWVIYRFTATMGTNGAQYRFHLPATPLTVSVWSVARTVRLL